MSVDSAAPVPDASLDPCAPFTPDPEFEALRFDGHPLDKVYGAWGLADDDIYVALGDEASRAAVAHWNGSVWKLDLLPKLFGVDVITGRSGTDLWLAVADASAQSAILRNSGGAGWRSSPPPAGWVADLILLPPDDGWTTVAGTEFRPGVTLRLTGSWSEVTLPSIGEPDFLQELRAKDAAHVYAIGHAAQSPTSAEMARFLGAFDGTSWKMARLPTSAATFSRTWWASPPTQSTPSARRSPRRQRDTSAASPAI